ncbi:hypothetical protein [Pseudomonas sp. ACM7]|uniref:hypothetical protein n=1 Tax=Pseudomonas sp. ACM7 TaxID=2052956 RepID=UPI0010121315|nr:hypothetical protein [Pseudomonas sp. ACM7]QAY89513.1 hypothetical protein CUN63_06020 [Pseudomonas sp. ACM7]
MTTQTQISIPVIVQPVEGSTVSDPFNITGSGEPGATVEVAVAGGALLISTVSAAGTWQGSAKLLKGVHSITARQRRDGFASAWSPDRAFTVD